MTDILAEVLSDQHDEKKLFYLKRILPIVIILTIVVVFGMVLNNWYKAMETKNNQNTGDILIKAMASRDRDKELTIKALENLIVTSNNKVREIAILEQVGIKIESKDYAGARELLESAIN